MTPGKFIRLRSRGLAAVLFSLITSHTYGYAADPAPVNAIAVTTQVVSSQKLERSFSATGSVNPRDLVQVSALSNGLIISEVSVREGEYVQKGEILARLNTELLEAQIREKIALINGNQASYDAAHAVAERARVLALSKAIAQETLEQRIAAEVSAKATMEQTRAALDTLNVQLKQATIVSPVEGIIAAPPLLVGSLSSTATPMFQIIAKGELEVWVKVPQQYLVQLQAGQPVSIANDDASGTNEPLKGAVRAIAEKVDATTRLGTVYVTIPKGSFFRTGMFVRVAFNLPVVQTLAVPEAALIWQAGSPAVYQVSDDKSVHAVAVSTGERQGGLVAVSGGLKGGETIVVDGAAFLTEGASVNITNADAPVAK